MIIRTALLTGDEPGALFVPVIAAKALGHARDRPPAGLIQMKIHKEGEGRRGFREAEIRQTRPSPDLIKCELSASRFFPGPCVHLFLNF